MPQTDWLLEHQRRLKTAYAIVNQSTEQGQRRQAVDYSHHAQAESLTVEELVWKKQNHHSYMSLDTEHDFITGFIDLYRQHECLWLVICRDYVKKVKCTQVYEEIAVYMTWHPSSGCTKRFKFSGLFQKEHKKIKEAGKEDIYYTNFWYYDQLMFLVHQEPVQRSFAVMAESEEVGAGEEDIVESPNASSTPIIPSPPELSPSMIQTIPLPKRQHQKKTNTQEEDPQLIQARSALLKTSDESDSFG
ncbi:uncharacterized protein LOC134979977 [Pseudophryne corroboree]|uniref:uncharacterized protein LOC134979977 n=1 Tax=Pseudophryne corroboree TaxID=495146 RepID=UPI003081D4EE